jgi:hypothetical protein
MKLKYYNSNRTSDYKYPVPVYYLAKVLNFINPFIRFLDNIESAILSRSLISFKELKPIYITGLARAGTTITLEMLSKHPDIATHRYLHIPNIYLPFLWTKFALKTKIFQRNFIKPAERLHKDGIFVNRDSPEALEEVVWKHFFNDIHDETQSNVMNRDVSNKKFEKFYQKHLIKILFTQKRTRYLTKNNYNVTRMEYLFKILPDAKFLLIIRNPIDQIASLIKQSILFKQIGKESPHLLKLTELIGHHEFGNNNVCINTNNTKIIQKIREYWINKSDYVKGWAIYWASVYEFAAKTLDANKELANATLIVRYDDLVDKPSEILDKILEHTELSKDKFRKVKEFYVSKLHKPNYYQAKFSKQEEDQIKEIAGPIAAHFGLKL